MKLFKLGRSAETIPAELAYKAKKEAEVNIHLANSLASSTLASSTSTTASTATWHPGGAGSPGTITGSGGTYSVYPTGYDYSTLLTEHLQLKASHERLQEKVLQLIDLIDTLVEEKRI